MTNEIDQLMDLDPLELTADNIDQIISYHRKARANTVAGGKPKRESGPKVEIGEALKGMFEAPTAKATGGIRRR